MNRTKLMSGAALILLAGCSLEPRAAEQERLAAIRAGAGYRASFDKRTLPELPAQPDWTDVLQRAFLANGDLEAAYFEWRAAVAKIAPAASWPNSNLMLGADYAFSKEGMKGWDATTVNATVDPAMMLTFPVKSEQAGKVALDAARAASQRFRAAKFALQLKVLTTWLNYSLTAEKARIQAENVSLLKAVADIAAERVRSGAPQQDLLKAQTEYELAGNELANMESESRMLRAELNGMLARPPDAPLPAPARLPPPRSLPADDARLIAVAARDNPELAELAEEVAGRADALELARLAYLPDLSPQVGIEGNAQQMVGMMFNLPTNLIRIRGQIDEAEAEFHRSQAMTRQARFDRASQFVGTLYALRNSEREAALLDGSVLPKARQLWEASGKAYSTASIGFADLIDTQRTLLQVRVLIAEARIAREKRLAELEALAGTDVETLAADGAGISPATQAAEQ